MRTPPPGPVASRPLIDQLQPQRPRLQRFGWDTRGRSDRRLAALMPLLLLRTPLSQTTTT